MMNLIKRFGTWLKNWVLIHRSILNTKLAVDAAHEKLDYLSQGTHEWLAQVNEKLDGLAHQNAELQRALAEQQRKVAQLQDLNQAILGTTAGLYKTDPAGHPVSVAFLVHNFEAWGALRSVYLTMRDDPRFAPVVFAIPRKFPGSDSYGQADVTSARLTADDIAHICLDDADPLRDLERLRTFAPRAIFRQSHWAPDIPDAFNSVNLSFARQYYVPYEITTISEHGLKFVSSFHHNLCDRVFVASDLSKEIAVEHDLYGGARMTVTGHPKVPEVLNAAPSWPIASDNHKRIIWSAHHAIDTGWNNFGVFPQIYVDMLALARRRPDLDILFSPHPALLTLIAAMEGQERADIDAFMADWAALPNTGMLDDGRYAGPFHASDLLIVDGLSFLIEYQLVEKPIIHLARADRSPLNPFGQQVIRGTHEWPARDIAQIEPLIDRLLEGPQDAPQAASQAAFKALLTAQPDPARAIVEAVAEDFETARS